MSKSFTYKTRIADVLLARKLKSKGAVLIEGPKWCGKTTTAKQQSASLLALGDTSILEEAEQQLQIMPKKLLLGDVPRLIDEWQSLPQLWDMIRTAVDDRSESGQFILTGSSVPVEKEKMRHSGTGRIGRICMRPMSLWESGESTGSISLQNLFLNLEFEPQSNLLELDQIAFLLCRGGWPRSTNFEGSLALDEARDYFEAIYKVDIHRIDNIRRNSERTRNILRSYARNQGNAVSLAKIADDIKENDNQTISYETISDYVDALKKLFVLEDMPAWNPNLRSRIAIQSSNTRYCIDPSIATSALYLGPNDLMNDLLSFGMFFESMAVRDLRTYADVLDGSIFHYRDASGLECDTILHRRDGTYGLIEIKLGGKENIEKGSVNLKKLAQSIDTTKMPAPSFCMVLTAVGRYAYRRPDGIFVVPIGCLKP